MNVLSLIEDLVLQALSTLIDPSNACRATKCIDFPKKINFRSLRIRAHGIGSISTQFF